MSTELDRGYNRIVLLTALALPIVGVAAICSDATGNNAFPLFILIGVLALLYFVPAMVAHKYKRRQRVAITVLNVLLGWTFIGWVGALVWACINDE
jgi:hypothetical protein